MFYKLLGMVVWKGGKLFLRRRYGSSKVPKSLSKVPKSLLAGVLVAILGGVAVVLAAGRHNGSG
jgi:hypothetical protein